IGHVIADGTSYNVTAQVPKVEQNTMTIQTDNNQPVTNGIASVFNNWSDGNTSSIRTITVGTDLISYTAIYKGKPLTSGRYLHFNDGAYGSPVTLSWNAHPSTNVTGCKIYRKVRVNGVMGNEYLIASVSASSTSYVDNDYTVSNNTTTQLFYDVRYVYNGTLPDNTPYTTESDPNYVNIYGQTAASYNDSQKQTASVEQELPSDYSIGNYPNPFNPTTTINYQLPENGFVTIKVYDVLGKEVATLVNENKSAGYYNVNFDASSAGGGLTSGVYIYTINANGFAQSKKMLLMK
ncbi:MAG: T9SS type A sorting domain-containing protein, partial [Bacteroidota bacterium]